MLDLNDEIDCKLESSNFRPEDLKILESLSGLKKYRETIIANSNNPEFLKKLSEERGYTVTKRQYLDENLNNNQRRV